MKRKTGFLKRIGKYIIEIIIIIIGISLSFALNDWDKNKSERKEYKNYLVSLKQDIKVDSIQMENDIRSYSKISKGIDLILRYADKETNDSLIYLAEAIDRLVANVEFLPNNNTFEVLKSTGDFKVFKNDELVKQVVLLYQYDYAYIEMMLNSVIHNRNNIINPYLIDNIYFSDQVTFPKIKTDVNKLVNDSRFWNICYSYQGSCEHSISAYRRTLKRVKKINELITEELGEFK